MGYLMPRKAQTLEQFQEKVNFLDIKIIEFTGVDHICTYSCKHGIRHSRGWALQKSKHCCRIGYYESGNMWRGNTKTLNDIREQAIKDRELIDVSNTYIDVTGRYKKLANILCLVHNIHYSSIAGKKIGICPECNISRNREQLKLAGPLAWSTLKEGVFVSRSETIWLDSLGIDGRQVWLEDVKYKVDGYDSKTNTVYLYHGRFWHGCPETYNPDEIHPIVKVKMKDLYEKTMEYESKILAAGYKLITKWGT